MFTRRNMVTFVFGCNPVFRKWWFHTTIRTWIWRTTWEYVPKSVVKIFGLSCRFTGHRSCEWTGRKHVKLNVISNLIHVSSEWSSKRLARCKGLVLGMCGFGRNESVKRTIKSVMFPESLCDMYSVFRWVVEWATLGLFCRVWMSMNLAG